MKFQRQSFLLRDFGEVNLIFAKQSKEETQHHQEHLKVMK